MPTNAAKALCPETMRAPLALILAAAIDLDSFEFFLPDSDTPLTFLNEAGSLSDTSAFFLGGFEFGPTHLIHVDAYRGGDGFEAAYEAWVDDLPEINAADLPEAYQDADGNTFDDLAREKLNETEPCPNHWEREAWDAWHVKKAALAVKLLREYGTEENGASACDVYPEIVEGYREDSSGRVKDLGHYENFYEADLAEIEVRPKK